MPTSAWLNVTGWVPNLLDSRIRAARPPTLVHTMSLTVWLSNPAEEQSSGAARLGGVAAIALAAQVATHLAAVPWVPVLAAAPGAANAKAPARTAAEAAPIMRRRGCFAGISCSFHLDLADGMVVVEPPAARRRW